MENGRDCVIASNDENDFLFHLDWFDNPTIAHKFGKGLTKDGAGQRLKWEKVSAGLSSDDILRRSRSVSHSTPMIATADSGGADGDATTDKAQGQEQQFVHDLGIHNYPTYEHYNLDVSNPRDPSSWLHPGIWEQYSRHPITRMLWA